MGNSASGNLTRIDNVLNNFSKKIEDSKDELERTKKELEKAKSEVNRPFPQEQELNEKSKRLDELNIKLNLNEKTNEIIDDKEIQDVEENQVYKEDYER